MLEFGSGSGNGTAEIGFRLWTVKDGEQNRFIGDVSSLVKELSFDAYKYKTNRNRPVTYLQFKPKKKNCNETVAYKNKMYELREKFLPKYNILWYVFSIILSKFLDNFFCKFFSIILSKYILKAYGYLHSGNIMNHWAFPVRFMRFWRLGSLQNPCKPLLPTTPEILHIIVSSSWQICCDSGPLVPKFRLKFYYCPLFLSRKFHATVTNSLATKQALFSTTYKDRQKSE